MTVCNTLSLCMWRYQSVCNNNSLLL